MCDYCSEAEALAEREDDNCILYEDDWDFYDTFDNVQHFQYSGSAWNDYINYGIDKFHYEYNRRLKYVGRKPKLGKKIEHRKSVAESTAVGNKCRCTMCGKFFEKKSYQQKFCSDKCRIKYHNKRKVYV